MKPHRRLLRWWPALFLFFLSPATAHAHTPIQGMGEFVNGLLHPVVTLPHALLLIALGLLMAQRTPLDLKTPLVVFVPLSALALALTATRSLPAIPQAILIALAMIAAVLVAVAKPMPPLAWRILFAVAAIAIGLDSPVESTSTFAIIKTLFGTWLALVIILADIAFYASVCNKRKWTQIGVRVIGSWIVAISLLVLAFALKKSSSS